MAWALAVAASAVLLFGGRLCEGAPLEAFVASSFKAEGSGPYLGAPAIFGFTTSDQDFYSRFQLELRVVFLLDESQQPTATLPGAPVETCHDILAEASDFFPAPLSCYSKGFEAQAGNGIPSFFGIRFGDSHTLQSGSSYRFVVPSLQFLRSGPGDDFKWRLEFLLTSGELMESVTVSLTGDVLVSPAALAGIDGSASLVESFMVRGGSMMSPGTDRQLILSFRLNSSYPIPAVGQELVLAVTFFPLLLWDQGSPVCSLDATPFKASCVFARLHPRLSYNRLLIKPVDSDEFLAQVNTFAFRVTVQSPELSGFLPSELTVSLLAENSTTGWSSGPLFQTDLAAPTEVEPLELSMKKEEWPAISIVSAGERMEDRASTVILRIRTGATMRGFSLRDERRDMNISITASPFYVITGASSVAGTTALGTDRAPGIAFDGARSVTFLLGDQRSIVLGHVEYTVQLMVTNPLQYFWEITQEEPWTLALVQGPRPDCRGCSPTWFESTFVGPNVEFNIFDFEVLPSSLLLGDKCDVVFSFRLLNRAEQLELQLPEGGTEALACAFLAPASLDPREQAQLRCSPTEAGDRVLVTSRGSSYLTSSGSTAVQSLAPLPLGFKLSFKLAVRHAAVPHTDSRGGLWAARALDETGGVIGRVRDEDVVRLPLYSRLMPFFAVRADDPRGNMISAVQVQLRPNRALMPDDMLRVTAPVGFLWNFAASEFSVRPAGLNSDAPLPVEVQAALGTSRVLALRLVGSVEAEALYGFGARVQTPSEPPADYYWLIESFGPGTEAGVTGQRYEAAGIQAYELSVLTQTSITPWTTVRGARGPVTISFRTMQAVGTLGTLRIRSPTEFSFETPCRVSELQLGKAGYSSPLPEALPAAFLRCTVLTPHLLQLTLIDLTAISGFSSAAGSSGLRAGSRYTVTIHSLVNPTSQAWEESTIQNWHLETQDANMMTLDGPTAVPGFAVGEELPYAVILEGGPSTGEDMRAGVRQWVTVAFEVTKPTQPQQAVRLIAGQGSDFEAVCRVRNPETHAAPLGATPVGEDISECKGLGNWADMQAAASWEPRHTLALQIEVRNRVPGDETMPFEEQWQRVWRLCIGLSSGCEQMRVIGELPKPVLGLKELGLLASSSVLGDMAPLVVYFRLATSMPASGTLTLRAPDGFSFPLVCIGFSAEVVKDGYAALPGPTTCKGGAGPLVTGRLLRSSSQRTPGRALSLLLASEVQFTLGPAEEDRLMAHRAYAFAVSLRNPGRDTQPLSFAWELRTATAGGSLLDRSRTDRDVAATGRLLLPMQGFPLMPGSAFAYEVHSIRISFRVLTSQEGGDSDIVGQLDRIDIFGPVDRTVGEELGEWDFLNPPACSTPFMSQDGKAASGLVHGNVTAAFGEIGCAAVSSLHLGLVFKPSVLSPDRIATVEFAARNPRVSPKALWNLWRVRVSRPQKISTEEDTTPGLMDLLAAQPELYENLCEVTAAGFAIKPTLASIRLTPSNIAAGEKCQVDFELVPEAPVVLGMVVAVVLPMGFKSLSPEEHLAAFASGLYSSGILELLPQPTQPPIFLGDFAGFQEPTQETVRLLFVAPTGQLLRFRLGVLNTQTVREDGGAPRWTFEIRASQTEGADVLERTTGYPGYGVYPKLEVAGLFGSVRELSSRFNYVRITFRLPASAVMLSGGILTVIAPPRYILAATGFNRESLPPQSTPAVGPSADAESSFGLDQRVLNVTLTYPLEKDHFYAFSFSVTNPPSSEGGVKVNWQIWCYADGGRVVAANTEVPPFDLEARFKKVEVLPSSVVPTQSPNEVEVQLVLGSSALTVGDDGIALLVLELPDGLRVLQESLLYERDSWCRLSVGTFAPPEQVATLPEVIALRPLPPSSRCFLRSEQEVAIELRETLFMDVAYHFQLRLTNPVAVAADNTWRVFTERNGLLLHLAAQVDSFRVTAMPDVQVISTDVRESFTQLLVVGVRPTRHVMGSSTLQIASPQAFTLSCTEKGKAAPLGLLPEDTQCALLGLDLQITLPEPVTYAPYQPILVATEEYYFGVYCFNPEARAGSGTFSLALSEPAAVASAPARLLGLQAHIPAPELAKSLDFFQVITPAVEPPGKPTIMQVRFRTPLESVTQIRAILLEGPTGVVLSQVGLGGSCMSFTSRVIQAGDAVLPETFCTGLSERSVMLGLPETLPLTSPGGQGLTYAFELVALSPMQQVLSDLMLLALMSSPTGEPLFAASSAGFASKVPGLKRALPPSVLPEQVVSEPQDSFQKPFATVGLTASGAECRHRLWWSWPLVLILESALCT